MLLGIFLVFLNLLFNLIVLRKCVESFGFFSIKLKWIVVYIILKVGVKSVSCLLKERFVCWWSVKFRYY